MRETLFLLGPSDRDIQNPANREWVEGVGWKMTADFSGVLPIMPFVQQDEALNAHSRTVLLGMQKVPLRRGERVNLFNLVGDPDASPQILQRIDALARKIQPVRLFNAPAAVMGTSRAQLPETLAGIPGCRMPRAEAADPTNFTELAASCRQFGHWPLIVRGRGYHGGEHMDLVQDEDDLERLRELDWPFEGVFLIEFVDCRTEDGLYHRIRAVVIDGNAYPRACVFSDKWAIHAGSRADLMDQNPELSLREKAFLETMRAGGLPGHEELFEKIRERIGLDVFGIDFALVGDQAVIFEANACMRFLGKDDVNQVRNPQYDYLIPYKRDLRDALKAMLLSA